MNSRSYFGSLKGFWKLLSLKYNIDKISFIQLQDMLASPMNLDNVEGFQYSHRLLENFSMPMNNTIPNTFFNLSTSTGVVGLVPFSLTEAVLCKFVWNVMSSKSSSLKNKDKDDMGLLPESSGPVSSWFSCSFFSSNWERTDIAQSQLISQLNWISLIELPSCSISTISLSFLLKKF